MSRTPPDITQRDALLFRWLCEQARVHEPESQSMNRADLVWQIEIETGTRAAPGYPPPQDFDACVIRARLADYRHRYIERMIFHGVPQQDAAACFDAGIDDIDFEVAPEDAAADELDCFTDDGETPP